VSVDVSVVVATYNRPELVERLLVQLGHQTLPHHRFEVVVVDDGSEPPVAERLTQLKVPYPLHVVTQANAGAAAARHHGIVEAKGALVVVTDDDMQVPPHFLAAHVAAHPPGSRRAVLGRIEPDPDVGSMPYFERWYAYRLETMAKQLEKGKLSLNGSALYTGNVSFNREDYLAVGGFDPAFGRSEDAELGLRLEQSGVELRFAPDATTRHGSDHTSEAVWLKRAFLYGVFDSRIGHKHPSRAEADPWRFFFKMKAPARPLVAAAALAPHATKALSKALLATVRAADRAGLERATYAGAAVAYTMEYFRGVHAEAGTVPALLKGLWHHLELRRHAGKGNGHASPSLA
jgi:GT2 family glycosyltransferase